MRAVIQIKIIWLRLVMPKHLNFVKRAFVGAVIMKSLLMSSRWNYSKGSKLEQAKQFLRELSGKSVKDSQYRNY